MTPVANVLFRLPFDVAFRSFDGEPLVLEGRDCRFVLYRSADGIQEPMMTLADGEREWAASTVGVELPCAFDAAFDEGRIEQSALAAARSFLDLVRWKTNQPQINVDEVREPSSVQFFDAEQLDRSRPLGAEVRVVVRTIVGGALIASPTGSVMHLHCRVTGFGGALAVAQRQEVLDAFEAGVRVPLWNDYMLSAQAHPTLERKVMDLGIAAEVFIKQWTEHGQPGYSPPSAPRGSPRKGMPERYYLEAVRALKRRDISSERPSQYAQLQDLYRARNGVAHAGCADFDSVVTGTHRTADANDFITFLGALRDAITWVESIS